MSLVKLIKTFSDETKCRDTLRDLRWPSEIGCPRCGSKSISTISTREQWDCNDCRYRFSITSATIFDNTKIPLSKWFIALYLMVESKKGMSAAHIGRTIEVSYPTAWHVCHRIREAMNKDANDLRTLLTGAKEVDEPFVGKREGVARGSRSRRGWWRDSA